MRLGKSLRLRSQKADGTEALAYLADAIEYVRQALIMCVQGHPERPRVLRGLALLLVEHSQTCGHAESLNEALQLQREGLELCPTGDPKHAHMLNGLAVSSIRLYEITHRREALKNAIDYMEKLTVYDLCPPYTRLYMVDKRIASILELSEEHLEAMRPAFPGFLGVLRAAIALLPLVAYIGLDPHDQLGSLARSEGLGATAAATSLILDSPKGALELLEETRALFWEQALRLRTPLDDLPAKDASRLSQLFHLVDNDRSVDMSQTDSSIRKSATLRRDANREIEALIGAIRQRPHFDHFLRGHAFETIASAAARGPVVVLVAHKLLCEAIVLLDTSGAIKRVPISGVAVRDVNELSRRVKYDCLLARSSMARDAHDYDALIERLNALEVSVAAAGRRLF